MPAPSSKDRSAVRRASAALFAAAALVAAAAFGVASSPDEDFLRRYGELKAPAPRPDGLIERLEGWKAHACAGCHADVFEEWAGTLHALAWVSEPYRAELEGKSKPQGCHGCHIPGRLLETDLSQKPPAREAELDHGVDCIACHQTADGTVHGPWGLKTDAHASARDERFLGKGSDALCASCHRTNIGPVIGIAKDFPPAGPACVECHMAPTERRLEDGSVRPGRSHALQTPRDPTFLARAFEVVAPPTAGDGPPAARSLRIVNRAGHRLPGLIEREFHFKLTCFDAGARELGKVEAAVTTRRSLAADAALELELPAGTARVELQGLHVDPRQEDSVEFLRATVN